MCKWNATDRMRNSSSKTVSNRFHECLDIWQLLHVWLTAVMQRDCEVVMWELSSEAWKTRVSKPHLWSWAYGSKNSEIKETICRHDRGPWSHRGPSVGTSNMNTRIGKCLRTISACHFQRLTSRTLSISIQEELKYYSRRLAVWHHHWVVQASTFPEVDVHAVFYSSYSSRINFYFHFIWHEMIYITFKDSSDMVYRHINNILWLTVLKVLSLKVAQRNFRLQHMNVSMALWYWTEHTVKYL